MVSSFWKVEDVVAVGRELERGRFRKLGSHSACEVALTAAAGFVRDSNTEDWEAGWVSDEEYLSRSGWGTNQDFTEVPGRLLSSKDWSPRLWGNWRYPAGTLELEARALVKGLRRLSHFGHDVRQL